MKIVEVRAANNVWIIAANTAKEAETHVKTYENMEKTKSRVLLSLPKDSKVESGFGGVLSKYTITKG